MPFSHMMLSFEGRLRRRDYWLCSFALLFGFAFLYAVLVIPVGLMAGSGGDPVGVATIQILLCLLVQWPGYAISVKRCHDRDQSGWMLLIQFIPLIGPLWALVNLGFLDGTYGPNKYGQSPKDSDYSGQMVADTFS